jgi:hypothetical protein
VVQTLESTVQPRRQLVSVLSDLSKEIDRGVSEIIRSSVIFVVQHLLLEEFRARIRKRPPRGSCSDCECASVLGGRVAEKSAGDGADVAMQLTSIPR